jgi:hypothetical protein
LCEAPAGGQQGQIYHLEDSAVATTISLRPPDPGLHADLLAVEQAFPGWHAWTSDEGRIYAVSIMTCDAMAEHQRRHGGLCAPNGTTLDAATPAEIRGKISRHVEEYRAWAA